MRVEELQEILAKYRGSDAVHIRGPECEFCGDPSFSAELVHNARSGTVVDLYIQPSKAKVCECKLHDMDEPQGWSIPGPRIVNFEPGDNPWSV